MSPFSAGWSARIAATAVKSAGSRPARLARESAPTGRYTMRRCSTGNGDGHELERGGRIGRVPHDPLRLLGVEEEVDARERRVQIVALRDQLLLGAGR